MMGPSDLRRFVGLVILLMVPSFVLWMAISPMLASPAVYLSDLLLTSWMPDVVDRVQLKDSQALVMTHFGEMDGRIVSATVAGYQLGYPTDVRVLSYSIPFYAALNFATPQSESFSRFGWGLWILYPLIVLGLVCVILKDLMLGLGDTLFQQPIYLPGADAIGVLYQLSILIIPPLAPVMVWAWQSRESPLLAQFIPATAKPADDACKADQP